MATHGSLQELLRSIQNARGGGTLQAGPVGAPTPPPGVEAPPANAYNPAEFYKDTGHAGYAAQLWMSRHPYAVQNGQIPSWVTQAMHGVLGSGGHQNPFVQHQGGVAGNGMVPHQHPGAPTPGGDLAAGGVPGHLPGGTPNPGFHHFNPGGQPAGGQPAPGPPPYHGQLSQYTNHPLGGIAAQIQALAGHLVNHPIARPTNPVQSAAAQAFQAV